MLKDLDHQLIAIPGYLVAWPEVEIASGTHAQLPVV